MKNNKGFTMVELLVSIAILSFVITSLTVLMTTSSRTYANMFRTTNMQYESQIVMSQLQERIVDCNGGLAFDDAQDILYIVNINSDTTKTVHAFRLEQNEMLYGTASTTVSATPTDNPITELAADENNIDSPMSQYVGTFDIVSTEAINGNISSINVDITFSYEDRVYDAYQTIALRNKPLFYNNLNDLLDNLNKQLDI